jgi:hypothetical protein
VSEGMAARIDSLQRAGLASGAVGLLACVAGGFADASQAYRSYLFAFLFWAGVSVGCLSISMINHLTGGMWGLVIRRLLEAGTRTLPLVTLLFVPIALGLPRIYVWARPEVVATDALVQRKSLYLNPAFFLGRAVFYFAVWNLLAALMNRWSLALDSGPDRPTERRLRGLAGLGLVLLGLTITFSSVDWAMSLDPHWYSTMYGILFMVGQVLSALSLMILAVAGLGAERPLSDVIRPGAVHDLGKLLLAFVMLWTYIHLSQFLIVWSGNLPEEIPWYIRRSQGGWLYLALVLVLFHFALPFLLLLSRELKRNARSLALVAAALFAAHVLETFWLVGPDLGGHGEHAVGVAFHWLDVAAILGVGGVWLLGFARQLKTRAIVPVGDPDIRELMEQAEAAR